MQIEENSTVNEKTYTVGWISQIYSQIVSIWKRFQI